MHNSMGNHYGAMRHGEKRWCDEIEHPARPSGLPRWFEFSEIYPDAQFFLPQNGLGIPAAKLWAYLIPIVMTSLSW